MGDSFGHYGKSKRDVSSCLLSLYESIVEVRSEYELVEEGDEDRVIIELDLCALSAEPKKDGLRV